MTYQALVKWTLRESDSGVPRRLARSRCFGVSVWIAVAVMIVIGCGASPSINATASTESIAAEVAGSAPSTPDLKLPESSVGDDLPSSSDDQGSGANDDQGSAESSEAIQRQLDALADEHVSDQEYVAAYEAFVACANGLGAQVIESGREANTGLFRYSYANEHADTVRRCNSWHFARVDAWIQTHDPEIQEERRAESVQWFEEDVIPCLERFGIEVPEHLTGEQEDPEEREYWMQYTDFVISGDCE